MLIDLWDIYQEYRIYNLSYRIDRAESAPKTDALARDEVQRIEEKLDRLALITRAMFELSRVPEEKLLEKVVEIDLRDGQEVAVKEVSLAVHSPEKRKQILETVRNEYAVAVALAETQGIAKVRGLLSDPVGTLYIVQDLIKGTSLAKLYAPEAQPAKLLPLMIDVADALAVLHANRIVHRDLKPDNVMIRRGARREEAVLIDFGIALLAGQEDTLKHYGTAGYMAPEQARGDAVEGSADIYPFGKMIAEIWIGEGRAGKIPKPLAGIVDQMLAADPRKRPALDAVRAALEACCPALKS